MERVKLGFERYSPYVKRFGRRVGEMMKEAPEKVGQIAKYTTHKIGSISDAIDNAINSPLGELMINQLSHGLQTDVQDFKNINKLVGGLSKGGNKLLEGDYIGGFNEGLGSFKKFTKILEENEKKEREYQKNKYTKIKKEQNRRKNNFSLV